MDRFTRIVLVLLALLMAVAAAAQDSDNNAKSKRIALSFDDAPRGEGPLYDGDERATALIAGLAEANVETVVFFVTTSGMETEEGRARIIRYGEAGHLIANHTHSHEWLTRTKKENYIADIDQAETLLEGVPNRRAWFRFPFLDEGRPLSKRDALRDALAERELFNGYVTVDDFDWHIERRWKEAADAGLQVDMQALCDLYIAMLIDAVDFYEDVAIEALGRSPAHVLLLHENDLAAEFVDDLVYALRKEGWTIISPDEAYADPIASVLPQTLMTNQGHLAALAVDAGRDPRTLDHWAIDADKIDDEIERRNVFAEP